uniref:CD3 gamma/delta subunit Ig-like domain-containing protein n=1 Tax=Gasterosteus aculeatus aculeatus TaxID=481459 RepID=A0AAQ4QPP2_GASAC
RTMESAFPACLLLLWALTVFEVTDELNGIKLSCFNGTLPLPYEDDNTGEYQCGVDGTKIYVKFRTCDNCIELDEGAIAGMVVGNVVATLVIGVAVYLIASQTPIGAPSAGKKSNTPLPTCLPNYLPPSLPPNLRSKYAVLQNVMKIYIFFKWPGKM